MPTGYTINGTDFDNLFKPRVGTAGAACGYNVVTSTNPYVTQDLASRYEPSRGAGDRIPELTGLKNSAGVDLRDLFMNVGFQIIPTYTIVANKTSINETTDRTVTFTLTTTDVPNGTVLYVSLTRSDLTLSASTITVNSNTASFSATALDDATAEGYVTFQAILRKDSQTGIEVGRSNAIGLIDSSIPIPTYSIAPSLSAINEGGSVTFNVSTTNVNPGTTLYWTTSRTDLTPNNGSFVVSSGSNSFAVTANLDSTTEGPTSFTASLRTGSTSGGILVTSTAVSIADTSTTPLVRGTIQGEIYSYQYNSRTTYIDIIYTTTNVIKLELDVVEIYVEGRNLRSRTVRKQVPLNIPNKRRVDMQPNYSLFLFMDLFGLNLMPNYTFYITDQLGTRTFIRSKSKGAFSG
jgi:hypothetical protein